MNKGLEKQVLSGVVHRARLYSSLIVFLCQNMIDVFPVNFFFFNFLYAFDRECRSVSRSIRELWIRPVYSFIPNGSGQLSHITHLSTGGWVSIYAHRVTVAIAIAVDAFNTWLVTRVTVWGDSDSDAKSIVLEVTDWKIEKIVKMYGGATQHCVANQQHWLVIAGLRLLPSSLT